MGPLTGTGPLVLRLKERETVTWLDGTCDASLHQLAREDLFLPLRTPIRSPEGVALDTSTFRLPAAGCV